MDDFCPPRYATLRNPDNPTFGHRIARVSSLLGQPFMGWQQYVADVGGELIEARPGIFVPKYREIIFTVPRQNGKTTIVLSWEMERATLRSTPQRIAYSAQTGLDARKKLLEDQVPMIEASKLASLVRHVRRKNGEEGVDFHNGSKLDVQSGTKSAGHGRTLGLGVVDEAFDDVDDRREGSMLPAMNTVIDAQLIVCSTMGTEASMYLNRKVESGRLSLVSGQESEIAYFEWSAPDDADIDSVETWKACMPAFGHTVSERAVRHARQTMSEGEFRRAFLNQLTTSDERVIPLDVWLAVQVPECAPDGELIFAIDCDPERTRGALAVVDRDGNCEVIAAERGTAWLVPTAAEKARKYGARVAYTPDTAGVFGDELEAGGVRTIKVAGLDFTKACSHFFDAVIDKTVAIRPHEALNAAVAGAQRRSTGDAWVWSRKNSDVDISPLVCVTLASWAVVYARKPMFIY
jgi:hypothetical protein